MKRDIVVVPRTGWSYDDVSQTSQNGPVVRVIRQMSALFTTPVEGPDSQDVSNNLVSLLRQLSPIFPHGKQTLISQFSLKSTLP